MKLAILIEKNRKIWKEAQRKGKERFGRMAAHAWLCHCLI
jgi:hypothetical protein